MNAKGDRIKPIVGISLICLAILLTACSSAGFFEPGRSNFAILTVAHQTLELTAAYTASLPACAQSQPSLSDEELIRSAHDSIGWRLDSPSRVMYKSDFAVLIFPPDLGGVLISSLCDGTVLYAGSIIWAGHGGQSYPDPDTALNAFSIRHTSTQASPPQSIDVVSMEGDAEGELREEGLAAWNSVSDLNLVQELSSSPYNVLIYFYSPSLVVEMDEAELEWIIFVHPLESKK